MGDDMKTNKAIQVIIDSSSVSSSIFFAAFNHHLNFKWNNSLEKSIDDLSLMVFRFQSSFEFLPFSEMLSVSSSPLRQWLWSDCVRVIEVSLFFKCCLTFDEYCLLISRLELECLAMRSERSIVIEWNHWLEKQIANGGRKELNSDSENCFYYRFRVTCCFRQLSRREIFLNIVTSFRFPCLCWFELWAENALESYINISLSLRLNSLQQQ